MKPPHAVWDGVLRRLGTELSSYALEVWLHPLRLQTDGGLQADDDGLRLLAPGPLHREHVRRNLLDPIRRAVHAELGRPCSVTVEVAEGVEVAAAPASESPGEAREDARGRAAPKRPPPAPTPSPRREAPAQRPLLHTFDSFVVGPQNALAREASLAVATGRSLGGSPLFLTGPSGNGKTHLAWALALEARRRGRGNVRHVSAEGFTTQFLTAIRGSGAAAFKRRYRQECQLLVLEDVQFLGGKKSTQLELFHTLEHLRAVGAVVVFSGDRLPREIPDLEPRLRSHLSGGLVAEIEPPDAALRRNILRAKADAGGVGLPEACLDLLVEKVRGSVRDVEGVLVQLVTSAALLKRAIDLELTEMALRKIVPTREAGRRLDPREVVDAVASFFGITRELMASRTRRRDVLVPRQLAMYLCRRYTDASLPEVGRELGRDHPAVRNAIEVVERAILQRAPLRYRVEELASRLEAIAGRG